MSKKTNSVPVVDEVHIKDVELEDRLAKLSDDVDTGFTSLFKPDDMPPMTKMEIRNVTPKEAEKYWRDCNIFERQRPTKPKRLAELVRKSQDGRYHGGELALAFLDWEYEYGGKTSEVLVMNGQHQLLVAMHTQKPLRIVVKEFKVTRKEQLSVLWAQFDQPGGNRTASQVAGAYADEFGDGWIGHDINLFAAGFGYIRGTERNTTVDEKIVDLMNGDYFDIALEAKSIVDSCAANKHLQRKSVAAAMLASLKEDKRKAAVFWKHINSGVGCEDTEQYLRDYLKKVSMSSSRSVGKHSAGTLQVYDRCMQAWTAYKNGKVLNKWRVRMPKKTTKKD